MCLVCVTHLIYCNKLRIVLYFITQVNVYFYPQSLESLKLEECHRINHFGYLLELFQSNNVGLVKVNLSGCVNVLDNTVTMAKNCNSVNDLDISNTLVSDHGVKALAFSPKPPESSGSFCWRLHSGYRQKQGMSTKAMFVSTFV